MYLNLKAEIKRKGWTQEDLANNANMPLNTLRWKMAGKSKFSLNEAIIIKQALEVDIPLETLFAQA